MSVARQDNIRSATYFPRLRGYVGSPQFVHPWLAAKLSTLASGLLEEPRLAKYYLPTGRKDGESTFYPTLLLSLYLTGHHLMHGQGR